MPRYTKNGFGTFQIGTCNAVAVQRGTYPKLSYKPKFKKGLRGGLSAKAAHPSMT